jgi:hypothetical protein
MRSENPPNLALVCLNGGRCVDLAVEATALRLERETQAATCERLRAALLKIEGLGSRCTSDDPHIPGDDCPQCIARTALDA